MFIITRPFISILFFAFNIEGHTNNAITYFVCENDYGYIINIAVIFYDI